jgi:hypothetical protein
MLGSYSLTILFYSDFVLSHFIVLSDLRSRDGQFNFQGQGGGGNGFFSKKIF